MRKTSLAAFFAGLIAYPFALYSTTSALSQLAVFHGGENVAVIDRSWLIGRGLAIASAVFLATSVALAFLAPPSRTRKRMWWVVPATAAAIAIIYFDWIGFGFRAI